MRVHLHLVFSVFLLGAAAIDADVTGSLSKPWWPDTLATSDSLRNLAAQPQATVQPKLQLVKRKFNYGNQVVLAAGMMAFIALFMTSAQMWNPE